MIALIAAAGIVLAAALALPRLFNGPTLYDRALAANALLLRAAIGCAAIAVALGRSDAIDAAIALTFCAFVLSAAVLKFFRARTFQATLVRDEA